MYPALPRKMPTGIRKQSWHGKVGYSSGIFRDIPPSVLQRGKVPGSFFYKLSSKEVFFSWGWRIASSAVFPSVLGELTPSGLGGDPCLILPSLLQRDSNPHVLLCYPWQASTFTKKKKKKVGSK